MQTAPTIPNENDDAATEVIAADTSPPLPPSSSSILSQQHELDELQTTIRREETLGNVGCIEKLFDLAIDSENYTEMTGLCVKAARLGVNYTAMLMACYQLEFLFKGDLATTLRAHHAINNEIKTVQRGFAKRFQISVTAAISNRT